ncbi:MAG TPA: DUF4145 domain-containing protein [Terriglobales bacterium]|nr:DUF4145 domain-containing protein [Terriglobales bacterium]
MTEAQRTKLSKIYCNHCRRVTNHQLAGEHCFGEGDREFDEYEEYIYRLWICAGCERGTLESGNAFLGGEYGEVNEFGEARWTREYYPKRSHQDLAAKFFIKLKPKLAKIYRETIACYNGGALVLCSAGLRALLEGVCDDKRAKGRNLRDKINSLQRLLPNKNIIKNLHHFRFTGNQAVHQLEAPHPSDARHRSHGGFDELSL